MKMLESLVDSDIKYVIIKAKTKRLTLKYDRNGILKIRVPRNTSLKQIDDFINRHIDWIKENYDIAKSRKKTYETGSTFLYLGKPYTLEIISSKHEGVFINEDRLIVYVKDNNSALKVLTKWQYEQAELIFNELLYKCFSKMKDFISIYPTLQIKHYLSRWGCCYPKKKLIILNVSLIQVDVPLIEFVIFHELSHFKYQNHQKEFHNFLEIFCPNERLYAKMLKNYHTD